MHSRERIFCKPFVGWYRFQLHCYLLLSPISVSSTVGLDESISYTAVWERHASGG